MKTIKRIIISAIALVMALPIVAQEQYLHIYKGGTREKSYVLSSIDSMLIDETIVGSYMDLYNNGRKHRVGNIANIDEFRVGGEVLPSGIYMGVMGFNKELYTKPIGSLSSSTKSSYTSFVNNLTSSDGTILYYGVEQAIDALEKFNTPEDLLNVTLVTFTDGLDKGSHQKNREHGGNHDVYLTSLNKSIKNNKIRNIPINAYSIGLRGNDVNDVAQFQKNLQYLASSSDKAIEVTDISEVNAKLQEIADAVYKESIINTVKLRVTGDADGTKFRFVFDDVSDISKSTMYIEGTFRWIDNALVDVTYHGLTCDNGDIVMGEIDENEVFVTYTFENVVTSEPIVQNNIKHWFTNSSGNWEPNSEFTPNNNSTLEVTRKSALIMLVLDCSSSLGSQFSSVKTNANNFIGTLAGYGNDEGFSSIDISLMNTDIFSTLEKDEMVYVEGGTFTMGATSEQGTEPFDNEYPTHQVTLSDFYIGKYEVTQGLWEYVMKYSGTCADGSTMSAYYDVWLGYSHPSSIYGLGSNYPAYYVSWNDIVNIFISRLNKITGKTFRLPTEAEWEYAARGGNKSQGYKYSGSNTFGDVAWCWDNSSSSTHLVGTKDPNELGIYDMSGNVYEWCSDWYGSYSSSSQTNPTGPSSGSRRVFRGGSWFSDTSYYRVSCRLSEGLDGCYYDIGFRLACSVDGNISEGTDSPSEEVLPPPSFSTENGFMSLEKDEMVYVKGGTFTMGATSEQGSDYDSDELPTHQVTLSDFYIGKYEVTQQLWEYVMAYSGTCADGSTMSAYASDVWLGSNPLSSYGVGGYYPVYYVSWEDIVNIFIPRLNKITGKTFRLPTEAEWEYAARGGNKSKGYKYSGSNTIGDVAWYDGNACDGVGSSSPDYGTHQVGTKSPNELGIYDMTGNVYEWCSDWYGSYSSSSQTNPTGPTSGSNRMCRGGSWFNFARYCRVSRRGSGTPCDRYDIVGFRLVCESL